MSTKIIQDSKLYVGGYDLSGDMSALAIDYRAEMKDNTSLGDSTRSRIGGLKTTKMQHEGLWNSTPDNIFFSNIGLSGTLITIAPETGAEGELCYALDTVGGQYSPGAKIGDMFAFSVSAEAQGDLVRGTIMLNATKTATGSGTSRQLGAVASGQKLYAGLHVLAVSGTAPTLDVIVESDDNSGFLSGTTRITFAQRSSIGHEWVSKVLKTGDLIDNRANLIDTWPDFDSGAGTGLPDLADWWRISYTIGGTGPSFTFVAIIGIQ